MLEPKPRFSDKAVKKRQDIYPAQIRRKQLEKEMAAFLLGKHCATYGRAFDIRSGGESFNNAIEFFSDFFEEFNGRLG